MAYFSRDISWHSQQQQQQEQKQKLRNAGETFYWRLPNHVRQSLCSLFREIDANRDGTISVQELLTHVSSRRFSESDRQFASDVSNDLPYLFPLLDGDGNGSLDFNECKALFLLLSFRVVCFSCSHLILSDQFYLCTSCNCGIRLCHSCYSTTDGAYNGRGHHHFQPFPGVVAFPDLYAQTYHHQQIEPPPPIMTYHHQHIEHPPPIMTYHHQQLEHPPPIMTYHHQQLEHPPPTMALAGNTDPNSHLNSHNIANLLNSNTLRTAMAIGHFFSAVSTGGCVVM